MFLTLQQAFTSREATAERPRFQPELTYDITLVALLEYSCCPPLLGLNFIKPKNLMRRVGVHVLSHEQQE